jgi:F-type H+-transporting ATPase subunit b
MAIFSTVTASSGSLVDVDATIFIQLAIFLIMLFLLNQLLFRPVIRLIEARRAATEGTLAAASELEKEATELNRSAAEKLAEVRKSAGGKRDSMVQEAAEKERAIMAKARETGHGMVVKMKRDAQSSLAETKAKLESETASFASMIATKMLNRIR